MCLQQKAFILKPNAQSCFHSIKPKKYTNTTAAWHVKLNCLCLEPTLGLPQAQCTEQWNWPIAIAEDGENASPCRSMPTVHPCCVLDGRCTLGADAHDLLLSEQTRSFITHNLESLFYSAWALMLLLTQKMEYVHFGSRQEQSQAAERQNGSRSVYHLSYSNPRYIMSTKCASIVFVSGIVF